MERQDGAGRQVTPQRFEGPLRSISPGTTYSPSRN